MLLTSINREQLLELLTHGGVVSEVGVYRGGFARAILRITRPHQLHLIDPWGLNGAGETRVGGGYPVEKMHQAYSEVIENFAAEIGSGQVVVHRNYSGDVAREFPDASLDWVNIDALHDYASVLADLQAFASKVKPEGFILGHDFTNSPRSRVKGVGVIRAVREFVAENFWELVAITNEAAPSYLLARRDNTSTLPKLRDGLLSHRSSRVIEIPDHLLDRFELVDVVRGDGQKHLIIRFS